MSGRPLRLIRIALLRGYAHIEDRFACFSKITLQAFKVVAGLQLCQLSGSHRAADIAGNEATDMLPLKRFSAGELHTRSFPKAFAITAGVPSVIQSSEVPAPRPRRPGSRRPPRTGYHPRGGTGSPSARNDIPQRRCHQA